MNVTLVERIRAGEQLTHAERDALADLVEATGQYRDGRRSPGAVIAAVDALAVVCVRREDAPPVP